MSDSSSVLLPAHPEELEVAAEPASASPILAGQLFTGMYDHCDEIRMTRGPDAEMD